MTQNVLLPLLAALAGSAYAATSSTATANSTTSTVIDILLPMVDSQTVMASIEGVDATATSYFLTCPTGESSVECVLGSGMEVVEGPSVLEVHYTMGAAGTYDVSCNIASNTATCTSSVVALDFTVSQSATISSMATSTGVTTVTGIDSYSMAVTVTAGLEKLDATGTAAAGTAATGTVATGGMPRMTQNAVLAGAAAMVGGVLFM